MPRPSARAPSHRVAAVNSEAEPDAAPPHAVAARPNYVKLNHPVVMIFSWVGEGTPRCVNVQSAGQIKVRPFLGCTIKFWWQNSVPPAREPRVDSHVITKTPSTRPRHPSLFIFETRGLSCGRVDAVEAMWAHEDAIASTRSSSSSITTPSPYRRPSRRSNRS